MAAMKPRTGDGPMEVTKEGRGIVMRVPLEGGGRLVVENRDTVVLGGSTDNEHSKLGWRREHPDLKSLPIWNFADNSGKFARALGVQVVVAGRDGVEAE